MFAVLLRARRVAEIMSGMSAVWPASSSDVPSRPEAPRTVTDSLAETWSGLLDRPVEAARATAARAGRHVQRDVAWHRTWNRGRLLASAACFPAVLAGYSYLAHPTLSGNATGSALGVLGSLFAALILGSYLPRPAAEQLWVRTSPAAASAFFYVLLAGYALTVVAASVPQGLFVVAALAFGLAVRAHGTRLFVLHRG